MDPTIRVLLVDDCPTLRYGLRRVLESAQEFTIVGEAGCAEQAIAQIRSLQPDIALLDCPLPDRDGTDAVNLVQALGCPVRILAFSAYCDRQYVEQVLDAGAVGYLLKDEEPERIIEAVRTVAQGGSWLSAGLTPTGMNRTPRKVERAPLLTEREWQVLEMVVQGKTNKAIGASLDIVERTVRFHLFNVFRKIGARSRTEAAVWTVQHYAAREKQGKIHDFPSAVCPVQRGRSNLSYRPVGSDETFP